MYSNNANNVVVPILTSLGGGNGLIINQYLVTAAHVVTNSDWAKYILDGQEFELKKEDLVVMAYNEIRNREYLTFCDFAIYRTDFHSTDLFFYNDSKAAEQSLECFCYDIELQRCIDKNVFPHKIVETSSYVLRKTTATIIEENRNYMVCKMEQPLSPSNSGCPIIKDGKIFGILHGGVEHKNNTEENGQVCVFTTARAIIDYIRRNEISIKI